MRGGEHHYARIHHLGANLAVVVEKGESQEEAWGRYIADNPESVEVRVKIFRYPSPGL